MLLKLDMLNISYFGTPIVHNLSLQVKFNQIVSLIGPNGAGKSTILKAVMNIGDAVINSGNVLLNGETIKGMKTHNIIRKGVSYIPQGNSVFLSLTVEENLKIALQSEKGYENKVNLIYEKYPILAQRRNRQASSLSGGERQILGIARAMVTEPKILFMDEPTLGLSPKIATELYERVKKLKCEGTSILIVEQRVREALDLSDRIYILKAGTPFFNGTKEDLEGTEILRKAYFGG